MEGTPSFGYWVRRQRKALDLTRDELARQVGCAGVTIKKIETDERRPSLQIAERLAECLAIPASARATFLRCARGDLSPLHLPLPEQPVDSAGPGSTLNTSLPQPLPTSITPLIGRQQESARIQALLMRDEVRLLTLTGPGGIGKTRLALEVTSEVQDEFADGVYFVSLSPINDPALVVATICYTLGVAEVAGRPLFDVLKRFLAPKQLLLILDNFEHLLDAAPVAGDLLQAAPHLKVLVTSRAYLHLYGEHEFLVPPLALANLYRLPPLADLQKTPAIALFVKRARAAQPDFALTEENARAVAELCAHLDGLPLALELAAARVKLLSPETMLARLSDRLSLLSGGPRNLPARHQTLHRTIEWSYQLLDPDEQTLLRRLAVFAGGCHWQAIASVAVLSLSEISESQMTLPAWNRSSRLPAAAPAQSEAFQAQPTPLLLEQIEALLNQSLVRNVEGFKDEPRIGMLETIRAYLLQRLQEEGEEECLHRQHLLYYLYFAETARYHLTGAEAADWFERLAVEHNNLRVALGWAMVHEPVLGLRLAVALAEFWDTRGHLAEGRRWLKQFLTKVEMSSPPLDHPPALPAVAQLELARLAFRAGKYDEQEALAAAGTRSARQQNNQELLADALLLSGMAQTYQERHEEGAHTLAEVIALARRIHYPVALYSACQMLSVTLLFQNQPERAIPYLEESLELARTHGAVRGVGITLALLGFAHMARGVVEEAHRQFVEGMTSCAQFKDTVLMVYPLVGLIQVAVGYDQSRRAARLIGAVDTLLGETAATLGSFTRAGLETAIEKVVSSLGETRFKDLRREGQAMTLEQVIACALAED